MSSTAPDLIKALADRLAAFRTSKGAEVATLKTRGESVVKAANVLDQSFSGSWAGYHGRLYYKDFSRPPLDERWSVEWGGINGIPDGWRDRSPDEVRKAIGTRSGESMEDLEKAIENARRDLEDLRQDLVITASVLARQPDWDKERSILAEMEGFKFGRARATFVTAPAMASRDSEAMMQGRVLPSHVFYRAVGEEAASVAESGGEFLRLADRFVRQGQLIVGAAPAAGLGARKKSHARERVFVVHGHDEAAKEQVARFLEKLDLEAIVLHERPDKGRTIIEKLEDHADVKFAVVILTPDDVGGAVKAQGDLKPRARQNVVFEHGMFVGLLGRTHVVALRALEVEIPSDLSGVLYIPYEGNDWKLRLAGELKAAGLNVDLNKIAGG